MLLLLDIFEDGQDGHSLSVGHLRPSLAIFGTCHPAACEPAPLPRPKRDSAGRRSPRRSAGSV